MKIATGGSSEMKHRPGSNFAYRSGETHDVQNWLPER